jgi:hypothetical protein
LVRLHILLCCCLTMVHDLVVVIGWSSWMILHLTSHRHHRRWTWITSLHHMASSSVPMHMHGMPTSIGLIPPCMASMGAPMHGRLPTTITSPPRPAHHRPERRPRLPPP